MKAPSSARLPSAQSACWSRSCRLGWLLSTAQTAAAPWSPHAGLATATSLLWTHLFTFIGKVDCPPSQKPRQISERHTEHRVLGAPAGGVHHPCPSAGCGAAAGVGHWALPCHPSVPGRGEGQVGASLALLTLPWASSSWERCSPLLPPLLWHCLFPTVLA